MYLECGRTGERHHPHLQSYIPHPHRTHTHTISRISVGAQMVSHCIANQHNITKINNSRKLFQFEGNLLFNTHKLNEKKKNASRKCTHTLTSRAAHEIKCCKWSLPFGRAGRQAGGQTQCAHIV